ncbi:hypothetical protein D3C78_1187000 [compost metagenome]
MAGNIAQVRRQGAFHELEAVVEVVFQRPGGRFIKGDGRGDRFLAGIHARLIGENALTVLFVGGGLGVQ